MRRIPSRDIMIHVGYLDLQLAVVAQGVAWSPDVADDMVNRVGKLLDQSIDTLMQYGLFDEDEDEDEFGPVPDDTLKSPHVVYVEDDDNVNG